MNENMFNINDVTEMMFNAKFSYLLEGHNYAGLSEDLHNAKYAYLLEGFNYPAVSELWFAARN